MKATNLANNASEWDETSCRRGWVKHSCDQSICLMADIKLAQFALLKPSLSNTLIAGFNFGENKGGDIGMFVSTVNIR